MPLRDQVQLIAYADRLAGDLPGLARLLRSPAFDGAFGGVHVLPFFTPFDGADAGFDPVDHTQVDPRLGTWDDVRDLAGTHDVSWTSSSTTSRRTRRRSATSASAATPRRTRRCS